MSLRKLAPSRNAVFNHQTGMDFITEISFCKTPVVNEKRLVFRGWELQNQLGKSFRLSGQTFIRRRTHSHNLWLLLVYLFIATSTSHAYLSFDHQSWPNMQSIRVTSAISSQFRYYVILVTISLRTEYTETEIAWYWSEYLFCSLFYWSWRINFVYKNRICYD